jgi:subtilisin-like proprotein convertase family protein
MFIQPRRLLAILLFTVVFLSASGFALAQNTVTFTNPGGITIPDSGKANPYPSTITVSGVNGTVLDVNVSINGFNHTFPDDVDVLLVGPTGQTLVVMSDVGTFMDVNNVNLTFDDEAATSLPDTAQITAGTYRPTNWNTTGNNDGFPAPAPGGTYGTTLSVFDALNANGNWLLYVNDDLGGDVGSFSGGWSITITYQGVTITIPVTVITVTPKFKDGRVNNNTNAKDLGAPVAIFCDAQNGITVLFTEGDRAGSLAVNVPVSTIESVGIPSGNNATLGEANGVLVSRLTTGEFQINASYLADSKAYIVAWTGCPATSFTNLAG